MHLVSPKLPTVLHHQTAVDLAYDLWFYDVGLSYGCSCPDSYRQFPLKGQQCPCPPWNDWCGKVQECPFRCSSIVSPCSWATMLSRRVLVCKWPLPWPTVSSLSSQIDLTNTPLNTPVPLGVSHVEEKSSSTFFQEDWVIQKNLALLAFPQRTHASLINGAEPLLRCQLIFLLEETCIGISWHHTLGQ